MEMNYAELEQMAQAKYDRSFNHTLHAHIEIAGDLVAGTLLSQILYWFSPDRYGNSKVSVERDGFYWIAKEKKEWEDEIKISSKQFDRAVRDLVSKGLITKKVYKYGTKTTTHVRPNWDEVNNAITKWKEDVKDTIIASRISETAPKHVPHMGSYQRAFLESTKGDFEKIPKGISRNDKKGVPSIQRLHTEITNKDYKQQHSEKNVVVVRENVESKFDKKITKKQATDLILLADKHEVDLESKIENTYKYHTQVKKCTSVVGAIKYAIKNGDWEIPIKARPTLPKAVAKVNNTEIVDESEYEAKRKRVLEKMNRLG